MLVATWNVNSLKARLPIALNWLSTYKPNVLMLQEIKGEDHIFPFEQLKEAGYHSYVSLQKAYNGVATLTLNEAKIINTSIPNFEDIQARFVEVELDGIRYINVYVPNGNPINTEKYTYKLNWLNALYNYIAKLVKSNIKFVLAGDFNIIPYDYDVYNIKSFKDDALYQDEVRSLYFKILNLGVVDAIDTFYPKQQSRYTWWHYMASGFAKNRGVRIDHILISPLIAGKLSNSFIDKEPRLEERPSDHTPVAAVFK